MLTLPRVLDRTPSAVVHCAVAVAVAALCGASSAAAAERVSVFAAASLTDVLTALANDFQASTGQGVEFNFAASSALALQIREGARADMFFSADEAKMDALQQAKAIEPGTRVSLLSNSLVCVVQAQATWAPAAAVDLAQPQVRHIALAEPATVPAGIYAKEFLTEQGVWPKVAPRIVPVESVRAVLAAVESGNADAGIVYRTDARISKRVRVAFEVPAEQGPRISYPVALVHGGRTPAAARAFLAFLQSPAARRRFEEHGFSVIAPAPQPASP